MSDMPYGLQHLFTGLKNELGCMDLFAAYWQMKIFCLCLAAYVLQHLDGLYFDSLCLIACQKPGLVNL
ncbi:hypothetical protein Riv7116_1544 [Rivularia sp. PCC 7116]|uniref:hypothetical protein n=1 Tax=Rivularia sp. PCC 7116 TaxID=373994 RepID=UPI00029F2AC5|nr:hypothetical protein [Rivularia sp. PCC 7116]AFY54104.1 hypothetical protein Riv7116_1544 [Rivularia sp. PCC 7116]